MSAFQCNGGGIVGQGKGAQSTFFVGIIDILQVYKPKKNIRFNLKSKEEKESEAYIKRLNGYINSVIE